MGDSEEVVMTAMKKNGRATMRLERKRKSEMNFNKVHHVAGGPYKGIYVNKTAEVLDNVNPCDARLEFLAYLIDQDNGNENVQDYWTLRFWFRGKSDGLARKRTFTDYFADLINPKNLPSNYIGFVKKALVLLQRYKTIRRVEFEIEETDEPSLNESRQLIRSFTTVYTPSTYVYQHVREVTVNNITFLTFKLKAAGEAHISLSAVYGDVDRKTYEIVIGAEENTKSLIRDGSMGPVKAESTTARILNENESRFFWISWEGKHIEVGKGSQYGFGRFLHWKPPPNRQFNINCLAVSTSRMSKGVWDFAEIIDEEAEQEKKAKRAKIRTSLLWLARKQKMLQCLEDAYPNSIRVGDLLNQCKIKQADSLTALVMLREMQKRGIIKEIHEGVWMRIQSEDEDANVRSKHEVKIVKEMPTLTGTEQPTIGIITGLYCEKLAVDAMMDKKITFVKYKTEGESQVYTVGLIGGHKVVSTKLSRMGGTQGGMIAAENTVTRLLGTFNRIEHVLLVGVGGAVPHYSDFRKHVRLGDVVVSMPVDSSGAMYVHCAKVEKIHGSSGFSYVTRAYGPQDQTLPTAVKAMRKQTETRPYSPKPWEQYIEEGQDILKGQESKFHRPAITTDKLFFTKTDGTTVQCEHPRPLSRSFSEGQTNVVYGVVASGRIVARTEDLRRDFSQLNGVKAFDAEYDVVLDSLEGNRNDSFIVIRGMADYTDGAKKEWQPYAALVAAAYMKALILQLKTEKETTF